MSIRNAIKYIVGENYYNILDMKGRLKYFINIISYFP